MSFRNLLTGIFAGSLLLAGACKEDPPAIDLNPTFVQSKDTNYVGPVPSQQPRVVVIEDVTGVRCPNCPKAHEKAEDIIHNKPAGRVVFVSYHPDNPGLQVFTSPFKVAAGDEHDSQQDFKTQEAGLVAQDLGLPSTLPRGAINRKLFGGETERLLDFAKWESYVNQELAIPSPCNITLLPTYDAATRKCTVKVIVTYTQPVSGVSHYLTLSLLESGITDPQEDNSTGITELLPNYVHNNVLRKMFTPALGVQLNATLEAGRTFEKEFEMELSTKWVWDKCKVQAIVHESTQTKNVVQAAEAKIQ